MRTRLLLFMTLALIATAAMAQDFDVKAQFKQKCAMCHGADGKTPTFVGRNLGSPDITTDKTKKKSDKELFDQINKGKGKMPAFGQSLGGDKNVSEMVKYVKGLK